MGKEYIQTYNGIFRTKKRYRIPSHDYTVGTYFVTINCKYRKEWFGKVINNQVSLSDIGQTADRYLNEMEDRFQYARIPAHIVMPDHVHFVICMSGTNSPWRVHTHELREKPLHPLIPTSLSSVVNHYKGAVTKWCRKNGHTKFSWQSKFHDRWIRDKDGYHMVVHYIKHNPSNWKY